MLFVERLIVFIVHQDCFEKIFKEQCFKKIGSGVAYFHNRSCHIQKICYQDNYDVACKDFLNY